MGNFDRKIKHILLFVSTRGIQIQKAKRIAPYSITWPYFAGLGSD